MKIQVNGNQNELPENINTVQELLSYYQLDQKVVIVERNEEIVAKDEHEQTSLEEGDKIELVHFVGGG